jgi:TonB-dependent receptor
MQSYLPKKLTQTIYLIIFLCLINIGNSFSQSNINLSVTNMGAGKTKIYWSNTFKDATQISLQRSIDSVGYFTTVFSPQSATNKNYSFTDFYPIATKKVFYRVLCVKKDGEILFSKSISRNNQGKYLMALVSNPNPEIKRIEKKEPIQQLSPIAKTESPVVDKKNNTNRETDDVKKDSRSKENNASTFIPQKSHLAETYPVENGKKTAPKKDDGIVKEYKSKTTPKKKSEIETLLKTPIVKNNENPKSPRKDSISIQTKVDDDVVIVSSSKKKKVTDKTASDSLKNNTAKPAETTTKKEFQDTVKKVTTIERKSATNTIVRQYGAPGKLIGKVINAKTGDPLSGATVAIKGGATSRSMRTDYNGAFSFSNIPSGLYDITCTYVGYSTNTFDEVKVIKDDVTTQDITMKESKGKELDDLVIKSSGGGSKKNAETVAALLTIQKNAASVSDGISAEAIKRTPDKNTSDILKRVSGASIQDDKFVIVRGLNDRYNTPLLNGSVLPSTESNKKAFAFDIFPASMLDNLTITKTATPDMHSEFVGGIINIVTKDIPTKNFQTFTFSLGYNTQATFNDRKYYKGGRWDWLGLDDGTRAIPANIPSKDLSSLSNAEKAQFGKSLVNNWKILNSNFAPNISFQYSRGINFQRKDKDFAGLLLGLTYSKSNTVSLGERSSVEYARGDTSAYPVYTYFINENIYSTQYLSGFIANGSIKLDNNNKLSLKNSISVNSEDKVVNWDGYLNFPDSNIRNNTNLRWFTSNVLVTSQLIGEHFIPKSKLKINWLASFNSINRSLPNQRRSGQNIFSGTNSVEQAVTNVAINQESNGSMIFSRTKENSKSIQVDISRTFTFNNRFNIQLKAGVYASSRQRDFSTRVLGIQASNQNFDQSLIKLGEGDIWNSKNFGTLKNGKTGFYLTEKYERSNTYNASSSTFARYAMIDTRFFKFMRLIGGVRAETFNQKLNTFDDALNTDVSTDNTYTDINPSVNYIISISNKQNLRFCYSQTLNRPEYRELATVLFYDNDTRLNIYGNYNLSRAIAQNYDFRYEYYPSAGQIISVSAFHKKISNPIELVFDQSQTSVAFYNNAVQSTISGIELECRVSFAQLFKNSKNQFLKELTFFGNMALMQSDVELGDIAKFGKNRWLQGQSPYQYNGGFVYQNKKGLSATAQINQVGQRIFIAGNPETVNIMEKSRPVLDFQIAKLIEKDDIEVKLNIKDILALPQVFFYDINDNNKFDSQDKSNLNNPSRTADLPFRERRFGTVISASITYKF